ncbi:alcohol acetyltransferase, partial [Mycena galopus ATCC 62051]
GLMEHWHTVRHFCGLDSCIVASAQYTTEDGLTLNKEILFPALRTLIEEHAPLGIRFEGNESTGKVRFARLPVVDLASVVDFSGRVDIQEAYETHLSRRFETQTSLPLWRVEVLADNIVLFAAHHAICDGMSLLAFHLNLFRALQNVHRRDTSPRVDVPSSNVLLPPLERSTRIWPSFKMVASTAYALLAPTSWTQMHAAWTGPPSPSRPDVTTLVRIMAFPAPAVAAFTAAARTHGATLTSTFHGLAVCALSQLLADDPAKYKRIAGSVALSLRGVAGLPDDVLCDYPSTFHTLSAVAREFSWRTAARLAATLRGQKTKGRRIVGMLRLLELPGVYVPLLKGQLGAKREEGFRLSNLGRVQLPVTEGQWTIGRTLFAQCDVVVGAALNINVTGDPSGGVNVTLTWGETEGLERQFIEAFMDSFRDGFNHIVVTRIHE